MTKSWNKIKKEYIEGVPPREIAKKYKTTSAAIRSKACKENWKAKKETISNKVEQKIEDKINSLTNKALNTCEEVLDSPDAQYKDKLNAAKIIIDVSGLKTSEQKLTGGLEVQKVFVTPEMQEKTLEHIKKVINDK